MRRRPSNRVRQGDSANKYATTREERKKGAPHNLEEKKIKVKAT